MKKNNNNTIIIQGIQLSAHCGVSEAERTCRQALLVDLHFRCPNQSAFYSDSLSDTVDYGAVISQVRNIAEHKTFALLESLAEQLCRVLFLTFPITHLKLWVRKVNPPLERLQGSVGIQVNRTRPTQIQSEAFIPSPFLRSQLPRLPAGTVLDVAAGKGRHSLFLAANQFSVHAIDRDPGALSVLEAQAQQAGIKSLTTQIMDLEQDPLHPPDLGHECYEVIVVFFYLHRPLFPKLIQALKPGGMLLYETFLIDNHHLHQHPHRKEFCLERNELLHLLHGLRILHYEEGDHGDPASSQKVITTRMVAQKPI